MVVVGLCESMGSPVELALLNSIYSLPYPLIKLITILALQWAKEAYIQRLQDVCRVSRKSDRVNIPFKTKSKNSQVKCDECPSIRMWGSPLALY